MILSALKNYYDRASGEKDGPSPFGFAEIGVVGAINVRPDGSLAGLVDLRREGRRGKNAKLIGRRMQVPQPPKRTVAVDAGFLCDNAGYLFGYDSKGRPERALKQFEAARALHEQLLPVDEPLAKAILCFFATWQPAWAGDRLAGESDDLLTGWLIFQDAATGVNAHELPALRAAWERHLGETSGSVRGQCLVTGVEDVPLPLTHPAIKGVTGAQSSGAALVSFNLSAFTSYGKEQNLNAPIGAEAAFAYTTALNHLLRPESEHKVRIGDVTVVFWAETETPLERQLAVWMAPQPLNDEQAAQRVNDQIRRIADGRWMTEPEFKDAQNVQFFVLGLAPNAARLLVRFFLTGTLGEFLRRVQKHCQDVLFEQPNKGVRVPTLWQLADELFPKDDQGKSRRTDSDKKKYQKLQSEFLRAILGNQDFPHTMLPAVLGRLCTDSWFTSRRIGLLKACINRRARYNPGFSEPEVPMSLDENIQDTGYLLGRLFAVLENIQELSRGKIAKGEKRPRRPTIRDRFVASASVTPVTVFPYLLQLERAHEKKALRDNPGLAVNRIKDLSKLMDRLKAKEGFESQLVPRQRGLFFIGYYQQQRAFYKVGEAPDLAGGDDETGGTDDNEGDEQQ